MNASELIDESLGQTDLAVHARLEVELSANPELARTVERLRESITLVLDDGREIEPPPDLAARTLQRVVEYRHRQRRRWLQEMRPVSVPFRWVDVAMAAGIFLAGVVTLLPAIQRSRAQSKVASCAYNLQGLGVSLNRFAAAHGFYPAAPADYPAGSFALALKESGELPDISMLRCPCNGECNAHRSVAKYAGLQEYMAKRRPDEAIDDFDGAYAYTAGYQERGRATPVPAGRTSTIPLLSDQPPHVDSRVILAGNSPNHGGSGQNVLHADGHVSWLHNRFRSQADPDIFLNHNQRPAPGLHPDDAVLLPSEFSVRVGR
jgi:prepilin-type processing-associated H-X9-DG protein